MTRYEDIHQQLDVFDSAALDLHPRDITAEQLAGYRWGNLDRGCGSLYEDFSPLDGEGPIGELYKRAETTGPITVLDAGCGTGNQVTDLVLQASYRFGIDLSRFAVDAVSDHDFSKLSRERDTRLAIASGLVNYHVADLSTFQLPPNSYDLITSYEVLVHNYEPEPIIDNLWQALRPGCALYFNADGRQAARVDRQLAHYQAAGAQVLSAASRRPLLVRTLLRPEQQPTRRVYKLIKPADSPE